MSPSRAEQLEAKLGPTFELTVGGLLAVVSGPPAAAADVVAWLRGREGHARLATSVAEALLHPADTTAFVPFEGADAPLLNERRPTLARHRYRWVLWIDRAVDLEALQTDAQDTWSWRSVTLDLGPGSEEPPFVAEAVELGLRGGWAVSGVRADHHVDGEAAFGEQLAALRRTPAGARVGWTGVFDLAGVWRARWAHALVPARIPVLSPEPRVPGVVWVAPEVERYVDACRRLAGRPDPGEVAIRLALDPQRISAWCAAPPEARPSWWHAARCRPRSGPARRRARPPAGQPIAGGARALC